MQDKWRTCDFNPLADEEAPRPSVSDDLVRLMAKYAKVRMADGQAEAAATREKDVTAAAASRKRTIDSRKAAAVSDDNGGSE